MSLFRILAVVLVLATSLSFRSAAQTALPSATQCKIKFQVPVGWTIRPAAKHSEFHNQLCELVAQPPALQQLIRQADNVDVYTIEISVIAADFQTAARMGNFEHRQDGWFVLGRTEIASPVRPVSAPRWTGLKGWVTSGCFHTDDRGYAGLCDRPVAVLNNRGHLSAIITGNPQTEDAFNTVVKSFQFLSKD